MKKLVALSVYSLAGLLFAGSAAEAGTVGFKLRLSGTTNPTIKVENLSDSAEITDFVMSIGDTAYNFDRAYVRTDISAPGIGSTLLGPDEIHDGVRSDFVSYAFSGFEAGLKFFFKTDIDIDNHNSAANYKNVLFQLDGADTSLNSEVTVKFSDGTELSQTLPNWITGENMRLSVFDTAPDLGGGQQPVAAPLPAAAWSGISALAGMGAFARFRRRK